MKQLSKLTRDQSTRVRFMLKNFKEAEARFELDKSTDHRNRKASDLTGNWEGIVDLQESLGIEFYRVNARENIPATVQAALFLLRAGRKRYPPFTQ
jgi:hypothetical protein